MTTKYVVGEGGEGVDNWVSGRVLGVYWRGLASFPSHADEDTGIAVVVAPRGKLPGVTIFQFASSYTPAKVNDPVRVVAFDPAPAMDAPQMVLDGVVSDIEEASDLLVLTIEALPHTSGAVVLNADMQVIGMLKGTKKRPTDRAIAVHVDAVRGKLCEWGYISGSDCR